MDDAYCAGRLAELLGGEPTDAAAAAMRLARSFPDAKEGLAASQSARNLVAAGLADDIAWCARESILDVVPTVVGLHGGGAVELQPL
jgi:phosphosulfolactate phosphohydrolase-like enzyme